MNIPLINHPTQRRILRRLLEKPCGREELDTFLGWTNSPEAIRLIRESGVDILTTRMEGSRRGVYSLPATEKPKVYKSLSREK
jgi:hypothetical protein